jgi:hypothetical protein
VSRARPRRRCDDRAAAETAGTILLGKLSTWEFAIGGTTFDTPFPPARNPWNAERDRDGDGQRFRRVDPLAGVRPARARRD